MGAEDGRRRGGRAWSIAALAAATLAVLESLRVLFPTAYGVADAAGNVAAAAAVLGVFLIPMGTPVVHRWLGPRTSVVLALAWSVWRVVVQVPGTVPFWLAAVGTTVALGLLAALVAERGADSADDRVTGVVVGLVADVVVLGVFATWEPVWQSGPGPWTAALMTTLVVGGTALGAASSSERPASPDPGSGDGQRSAWMVTGVVLGSVLALEALFLLNPAALAAASGLSLGWAVPVTAVLALLVLVVPLAAPRASRPLIIVGALALAVVGISIPSARDAAMVAMVAVGQLAAGAVLGAAFRPRSPAVGWARAALGAAIGWVVLVLTTLLYQLHFDQPLPFDNSVVVAIAGALTVLSVVGVGDVDRPAPRAGRAWLLVAPTGLCVLALITGVTSNWSAPSAAGAGLDRLRVVQWNVRQGVDDQGQLRPDAVADAIVAQRPDVVVLHEVARGWPLSGDIDLATWVSRSLGMPFIWGAASGPQFGNVVLTRLPVRSSRVVGLPAAGRSQGRSATRVELELADGRQVSVVATHLQNRNDALSAQTRAEEVRRVADLWGGDELGMVIGDLNPAQGEPPLPPRVPERFSEIATLLDAGLVPTTDLSDCRRPTSNENCSDYVLTGAGLATRGYDVVEVPGFDHRLLSVVLEVR